VEGGTNSVGLSGGAIVPDDDYLYFDPKSSRAGDRPKAPRNKAVFQNIFVVAIGGGNYVEYQNLQEYADVSRDIVI
jgi:hypothetical protein